MQTMYRKSDTSVTPRKYSTSFMGNPFKWEMYYRDNMYFSDIVKVWN